ncbi:MAG: hypothetical protein JST20_12290 [Bacteroidetes bacterium]|nr:hypothetical protein [Bacteroidota bacterium]
MYEYPQTPLWKKLGIKEGTVLLLMNAPVTFIDELGELPEEVTIETSLTENYTVAILFVENLKQLKKQFPTLTALIKPKDRLWVAWYKLSAEIETDLQFENVQPLGLAEGLKDNKICALNNDWTALQFMVPVAKRKNYR